MISIVEEKSIKQIDNAVVKASIGELGLSVTSKSLEPMRIAGTATYGNFFPMRGAEPFQIDVEIRLASTPSALSKSFNYSHPSYH